MRSLFLAVALSLGVAACATPGGGAPSVTASPEAFQRDREAILAMAGDYRVTFDMRETVSFVDGYKLLEPKFSGGYESVRVVEDTGEKIALQHLLVVEDEKNGLVFVIKHWRQDWIYQPANVLTYAGNSRWDLTPVAAADRAGAWSQTVWQTDDSPRYGGVGRWRYDGGDVRWTSNETWRPLARRDAVRKPVYDRYRSQNRHALTPWGWVHEQDNAKLGPARDGSPVTFAHEILLNSYRKDSDYPVAKADAYWTATKDYWAAVRVMWDEAIVAGNGVTVTEEAEAGSITGPDLMGLADEIQTGTTTTEEAIAKARATIAKATATQPAT